MQEYKVAEYRVAGWDGTYEEKIYIVLYPNGKYYIHYGEFTDGRNCPCYYPCYDEGLETLEKAEFLLYKHRPTARKI